jgi:hypothetical protein
VTSLASARRERLAAGVVVVLLVVWGGLYVARTSFEITSGARVFTLWDDGMISMTYARNLARGHGLVWNPGEQPVQGFSNPGVTLAMAAIHLLPIDARHTSLVVQLLCLALLAGAVLCAGRIARGLDPTPGAAPAAMAAAASCASLAVWSLQGSDVAFVATWLLACVALLQRGLEDGRGWPAGLFALLAIGLLIRLDTAVFIAVFCAAAVLLPGPRVQRAWRGGLVVGGVAAGMLAASALYYGDPLPNTYYLKATGTPLAERLASGATQLGVISPFALVLPALAAAGVARRRGAVALVASALCVAALAYHLWVGGDWAPTLGSRFLAPVVPLLSVLAVAGSFALLERAPERWRPRERGRALIAAIACTLATVAASPGSATRDWLDPFAPTALRDYNRANVELGLYLREYTRPDTTIAVHFGGIPPYFGERRAIDIWGKSDRHIARTPGRSPFRPGHAKVDWPYVVDERRPDVILADPGPDASPRLKSMPSFRQGYLRVHDGSDRFLFFARRESIDRLLDPALRFYDLVTGAPVPRPEPGSD